VGESWVLNITGAHMGKAEKINKKKNLVIVPLVAVIHFILFLVVGIFWFWSGVSTLECMNAMVEKLEVVAKIVSFPWIMLDMRIKNDPFLSIVTLVLNSFLWGVAAYVVILICQFIKKTLK
jgi:hypothetical protein